MLKNEKGLTLKMPLPKIKAMATVPGAIFSVWHNISGAILASIYKQRI